MTDKWTASVEFLTFKITNI